MFSKLCNHVCSNMFIYTGRYIESHRNTQHITIYHKTHQKHQIAFSKFTFFNNPHFSKNRHSNKPAFYVDSYGTIIFLYIFIAFIQFNILRATKPNQFRDGISDISIIREERNPAADPCTALKLLRLSANEGYTPALSQAVWVQATSCGHT